MKVGMLKAVVGPKNKEDKFAAAIMKNDYFEGHLSKKTLDDLPKLFSTFYEPVT